MRLNQCLLHKCAWRIMSNIYTQSVLLTASEWPQLMKTLYVSLISVVTVYKFNATSLLIDTSDAAADIATVVDDSTIFVQCIILCSGMTHKLKATYYSYITIILRVIIMRRYISHISECRFIYCVSNCNCYITSSSDSLFCNYSNNCCVSIYKRYIP